MKERVRARARSLSPIKSKTVQPSILTDWLAYCSDLGSALRTAAVQLACEEGGHNPSEHKVVVMWDHGPGVPGKEAAVAIVGAESFGLLYDFLAKKSEAADDGRLNRPGTPGKVRALSERVFDIIPRDKTEAVTLAYRYMHLVEKLQDLE